MYSSKRRGGIKKSLNLPVRKLTRAILATPFSLSQTFKGTLKNSSSLNTAMAEMIGGTHA